MKYSKYFIRWNAFVLAIALVVVLCASFQLQKTRKALNDRVKSLRTIHLGIINASDLEDEFISSDIFDENGDRILSWRAKIVPFLFAPSPYPDIGKPWNHPDNLKTFGVYSQCNGPMQIYCFEKKPFVNLADETTNVFAITGKDTAFDEANRKKWRSFPPDLLVLIELGNSKTFWAASCDSNDVFYSFKNNDPSRFNDYLGTDGKGFLVVFYDGEIWYLKKSTPLEAIECFTTVSSATKCDRETVFQNYVIARFK